MLTLNSCCRITLLWSVLNFRVPPPSVGEDPPPLADAGICSELSYLPTSVLWDDYGPQQTHMSAFLLRETASLCQDGLRNQRGLNVLGLISFDIFSKVSLLNDSIKLKVHRICDFFEHLIKPIFTDTFLCDVTFLCFLWFAFMSVTLMLLFLFSLFFKKSTFVDCALILMALISFFSCSG